MLEYTPHSKTPHTAAFTLIELSIVLVIIGLIIGGILVGQDMIAAAATRAQIAQIEKYNSAVNTFRTKYNQLPGDIDYISAGTFGFNAGACDGSAAHRDGNGLIDGGTFVSGFQIGQGTKETSMFWEDLSTAGFIDGNFPGGGAPFQGCAGSLVLSLTPGTTFIGDYFPAGKIGNGAFLYVYEVNGANWYGLSMVTSVATFDRLFSSAAIPVAQAYAIDTKMDDGNPTIGNVQALYINGQQNPPLTIPTNANPDTASTCYNSSTNTYSMSVRNGSNPNCALSFKMQGAAR